MMGNSKSDAEKSRDELLEELNEARCEIARLRKNEEGSAAKDEAQGGFLELHDLFDNANDLIQSVNSRGEFLYVNKKWREILGYSQEDVEELDIFDIVHPDSQEHCRDIFQRIMGGEKIGLVEADFISKERKRISVEGNVNCRFEKGDVVATRAIFRDVTERREKESREIIKGGSEHLKVAELIQICNFFVPDDSVITVTNQKGVMGEIYISHGRILHASTGKVTGKKALSRMLGWEAGVYAINQKELEGAATIDAPLEQYLLDGARELDEFNNLKKGIEKAGKSLEVQYSDDLMKREYDPITAEVLSLAIRYKYLDHILDKSKYSDLDTLRAIIGLLQKGILRAP